MTSPLFLPKVIRIRQSQLQEVVAMEKNRPSFSITLKFSGRRRNNTKGDASPLALKKSNSLERVGRVRLSYLQEKNKSRRLFKQFGNVGASKKKKHLFLLFSLQPP